MTTKRNCDPLLSIHCWAYGGTVDDDINFDEDGQVTGANLTHETCGGVVEVLIMPDTPPAEVAKFLRKAAEWVEADLMEPATIEGMKSELERQERDRRDRRNREAVLDSRHPDQPLGEL